MAATEMMTPDSPLFGTPTVIGMSESASSLAHSSSGRGRSSLSGRATSTAAGKVSTYAETTGWARGEAQSRGKSAAGTAGRSDTHGAAQTRGAQDAYKPVFQDLPASFHSKEHMLYFAGQTLRSLVTGKAFINFVDGSGMQAGLLSVPPVQSRAPSGAQFEELRARILDESPSATRIDDARAHVANRRRALIEAAENLRNREPASPAGYRVKKKRAPTKAQREWVHRQNSPCQRQ
jgi:hypothetical protein